MTTPQPPESAPVSAEAIPTFDESKYAICNQTASPLHKFIYNQEPAGDLETRLFRADLQAALDAHASRVTADLRQQVKILDALLGASVKGEHDATVTASNYAGDIAALQNELEKAKGELAALQDRLAGTKVAHIQAVFQLSEQLGYGADSRPPVDCIREALASLRADLAAVQAERDSLKEEIKLLK